MSDKPDAQVLTEPVGPYSRVHDITFEIYGPDVVHHSLPAMILHLDRHHRQLGDTPCLDVTICDSWDALAEFGRFITRKALQRRDEGRLPAVRDRHELIRHIMVEHHLDVGKLPNPTDDELVALHESQPHHDHTPTGEQQ